MPSTHFDRCRVFIDWGRTGSYTEETTRLASASGTWRRNNPEDSVTSPRGIISQATITLINHDLRFSTTNNLSPLTSYIADGGYYQAPMYMTINGPTAADRIFTGVIKGPQEVGGNLDAIGQITFDCRSVDELLLQRKLSTTYANVKGYNVAGKSEAGFILEWLTLAGISSSAFTHDPGGFIIPWAWLDSESVLEDIWRLAAAGGGAFYADPAGQYIYESMAGWVDNLEAAAENFDDGDYKRGAIRVNDDELYRNVIVEVQPRQVAGSTTIWESPEQVSIPAGSTKIVVANLQQPVYELQFVGADEAASAGGQDMSASVSWTADDHYFAQRIEFTFTNTDTVHNAEIKNFRIIGRSLVGGPMSDVEKESTDAFWTDRPGRSRTISNQYIQTAAQAEALAQFLIDRHEKPRVFYILNDCPGSATRKLGNRIIIKAGNLVRVDRPALITGISWRWSQSGGFTQTIEAFDCFNLFQYAPTNPLTLGVTNAYCKLGTSTLDNDKLVFY